MADCLIKWNCPYCQERVSLDFKLLEQINGEYEGKITCPSCDKQLGVPEIHANRAPVVSGSTEEVNDAEELVAEYNSNDAGNVSCPNCWEPVSSEQTVCTGCGFDLKNNTPAPKIQRSITREQLTKLKKHSGGFLTSLFFEPFTFAICGPKPGKWTGHALGLVGLTGLGFVIGRGYGLIMLFRILNTLSKAEVNDLGMLQLAVKIINFADMVTNYPGRWTKGWLKLPDELCLLPAVCITIVPLLYIMCCPVLGSFFIHRTHKKLLQIIPTIHVGDSEHSPPAKTLFG